MERLLANVIGWMTALPLLYSFMLREVRPRCLCSWLHLHFQWFHTGWPCSHRKTEHCSCCMLVTEAPSVLWSVFVLDCLLVHWCRPCDCEECLCSWWLWKHGCWKSCDCYSELSVWLWLVHWKETVFPGQTLPSGAQQTQRRRCPLHHKHLGNPTLVASATHTILTIYKTKHMVPANCSTPNSPDSMTLFFPKSKTRFSRLVTYSLHGIHATLRFTIHISKYCRFTVMINIWSMTLPS